MDYKKYKLSVKEKLIVVMQTLIVAFIVSYLFFDSVIALIFIPVIFAIIYKK